MARTTKPKKKTPLKVKTDEGLRTTATWAARTLTRDLMRAALVGHSIAGMLDLKDIEQSGAVDVDLDSLRTMLKNIEASFGEVFIAWNALVLRKR